MLVGLSGPRLCGQDDARPADPRGPDRLDRRVLGRLRVRARPATRRGSGPARGRRDGGVRSLLVGDATERASTDTPDDPRSLRAWSSSRGVCALHTLLRDAYDLRIWLPDAPRETRLARAVARDGEDSTCDLGRAVAAERGAVRPPGRPDLGRGSLQEVVDGSWKHSRSAPPASRGQPGPPTLLPRGHEAVLCTESSPRREVRRREKAIVHLQWARPSRGLLAALALLLELADAAREPGGLRSGLLVLEPAEARLELVQLGARPPAVSLLGKPRARGR